MTDRPDQKLGANSVHPLQIEDARDAAHKASEMQRQVEDDIRVAGEKLADAEAAYRKALTVRILELRDAKHAITACETIAKGDEDVAALRYARDMASVEVKAVDQQAYRRGADRADIGRLLDWSMKRDLRVDTPPAQYASPIGGRRAA